MTHIKCKYDVPFCLMAHPIKFEGEFCGKGCGCRFLSGKDICKYFRFQHRELEVNVKEYEFNDSPGPDPDPGLLINGQLIPIDLISYLEIDGRVLLDFYEERAKA